MVKDRVVSTRWGVHLDAAVFGVAVDDEATQAFERFLRTVAQGAAGADAVGGIDDDGWEVDLSVDAATAEEAIEKALALTKVAGAMAALPELPLVEINVVAEELEGARSSMRREDVIGAKEVLDVLNITKQRLSQLRREGRFPAPLQELQATPIWRRAEIDGFLAGWDRGSGRRRPWPLDMMSRADEITMIRAKRDPAHPNVVMIGVWLDEDQESPPEKMRSGSMDGARRLATELGFVEVRNSVTGVIRWVPRGA